MAGIAACLLGQEAALLEEVARVEAGWGVEAEVVVAMGAVALAMVVMVVATVVAQVVVETVGGVVERREQLLDCMEAGRGKVVAVGAVAAGVAEVAVARVAAVLVAVGMEVAAGVVAVRVEH